MFCPPWINKYYIMDLAPGKSLVEWAVQHGLTVFEISYRNPDSSMRDFSFDDYLFKGPRAAIDVVRSITGSPQSQHAQPLPGWDAQRGTRRLSRSQGRGTRSIARPISTLLSIFAMPACCKKSSPTRVQLTPSSKRWKGAATSAASDMAHTFDLLRANDLVFRYVASNWLMGEDPPDFDLLAWNNDSTRMPAKMHTYYLRKFWIENALANDELEVTGTRLTASKSSN